MGDTMEAFVTAFREARGWSIRRLASELEYKSTTTLMRVLEADASVSSAERFAQQLHGLREQPLTQEESQRLDRVLERMQLGDEAYRANQLLLKLICTRNPETAEHFTLVSPDGMQQMDFAAHYAGKEALQVVVFNCEHVRIFGALARLEQTSAAPIRHYVRENGPTYRTVERVLSALPVLYHDQYQVFSCALEENKPKGLLQADMVVCGWTEDGQRKHELIICHEADRGVLIGNALGADQVGLLYDRLKSVEKYRPVRLIGMESEADFVAYCMYCAELERDRAVMRIKPDFGVEQIQTEILLSAIGGGQESPYMTTVAGQLKDLFNERLRNQERKKQGQYHVLKPKAVWHFVHTGRLSDQPYFLRPFTMAERVMILERLIGQMRSNPYFHLRFLKNADAFRDDEYIFYEGKGLCIIKPHTDYRLGEGHAEIMISQERFQQIYRSFYMNSILRYQTISEEQTLAEMNEMLRYARDHLV